MFLLTRYTIVICILLLYTNHIYCLKRIHISETGVDTFDTEIFIVEEGKKKTPRECGTAHRLPSTAHVKNACNLT